MQNWIEESFESIGMVENQVKQAEMAGPGGCWGDAALTPCLSLASICPCLHSHGSMIKCQKHCQMYQLCPFLAETSRWLFQVPSVPRSSSETLNSIPKDFLTRNLQQNLLWGLWTLERACFTLVFGDRWPHETAGRTTLWGHNTLTPNLLNIRNIVISHHHLKKTWHSCTIPWAISDSESKSHFAGRDSALFFRPRAEYVISY